MEEKKWKSLKFFGRICFNSFLLALIFHWLHKNEIISSLYLAIILYSLSVCCIVILEQWLSKKNNLK